LAKQAANVSHLHSNEKAAERRRTPKRKRLTIASKNGHVVECGSVLPLLTIHKAVSSVAGFWIFDLAPEAQGECCVSTRL
jgi:hypothetical protein